MDVARWAYILADVAADALEIFGVHITAKRTILYRYPIPQCR